MNQYKKNYTSNLYLLLLYMNDWTQSVDSLLDEIRLNSIQLTNKHIQNHLYYKFCSVYFEIPTIVLSVYLVVHFQLVAMNS